MEQLTTEQRNAIMNDDQQFKLYVMETLGELKADMKSVVGNGAPGRLSKLEDKVDHIEWWIALAIGGGAVLGYLIAYGVSMLPVVAGK